MPRRHLDFPALCQDHGITYRVEGHKHTRPGWVQVPCPFCVGNPGYHLGFSLSGSFFTCWRCGRHRSGDVLSALLGVPMRQALALIDKYSTRRPHPGAVEPQYSTGRETCPLPLGATTPGKRHLYYLEKRMFDAGRIVADYGLLGTGPVGPYRFRIVAPVREGQQVLTYQTRDVTGKQQPPYLACPKSDEVVHIKHTLYGLDRVPADWVVVVEGVPSVWRLGAGAVATYGAKWTAQQAGLLKPYTHRFVMFDDDKAGNHMGGRLVDYLSAFPGKTYRLAGCDAADEMDSEQAVGLMEEVKCHAENHQ